MENLRARSTIASILTTVFVANTFALEAAPAVSHTATPVTQLATSVSPPPIDTPSEPVETSVVSLSSAVGTPSEANVTVSSVSSGDSTRSKRIRIEDSEISELIEIDTTQNEIRAFGLTFHATRDGEGGPVALTISANGDSINSTGDSDFESMNPRQKAAAVRLNKFYAKTNVVARAQVAREILRQTIAEGRRGYVAQAKAGVHAQFDLANCIWDFLTLIFDWLSVVLACGPAIIIPALCLATIAWATYETAMVCRNAPVDCA
jgi:hypothetical protein